MAQEVMREKIKTLLIGDTPTEISRILDVDRGTVYRVKKRLQTNMTLKHKRGGGRPNLLSDSIKYTAAQFIKSDPETSVRKLTTRIAKTKKLTVSKSTVHLTLQKLKYSKPFPVQIPLLSEKNRLFRIEWAQKNKFKLWCRAVFADEASFWLNRGKVRMWTKSGKKRSQKTTKHSPKLHIWAAFSSFGTFPLCIFRQNLDAQFFVKILGWHLLTQAETFHGNRWFLVQDNDPKHRSKLAQQWISEKMPNNVFQWPSQSPDLNSIENLFGWLKNQVSKQHPKSLTELEKCIQAIWDSLTPEFLAPYWKSMRRRCQMVVENDGNKIKY